MKTGALAGVVTDFAMFPTEKLKKLKIKKIKN
jgi:hypothetical protein